MLITAGKEAAPMSQMAMSEGEASLPTASGVVTFTNQVSDRFDATLGK